MQWYLIKQTHAWVCLRCFEKKHILSKGGSNLPWYIFLKMPLNKSKQVPTFNKDLQLHLPKIGGFFAHWAPNSFPTQKQSELPCNTVREKSWSMIYSLNIFDPPAIYISTWWLNQPNWKILVKLDHSPSPGENKRYLKPPTFNHIDIQKGFIPTGCL